MVRYENFPSILKFCCLVSSLEGDVYKTIQSIWVVAEIFDIAWTTLCEKCDNKPLRFFIQMQSLEELSTSNRESSDHFSSLLNTIEESIANFNDLKRPTSKWDDIFNYLIVSRLPNLTRLDWIKHVESSKFGNFPAYKDLKAFLQQRIRSLQFANARTSDNKENQSDYLKLRYFTVL